MTFLIIILKNMHVYTYNLLKVTTSHLPSKINNYNGKTCRQVTLHATLNRTSTGETNYADLVVMM